MDGEDRDVISLGDPLAHAANMMDAAARAPPPSTLEDSHNVKGNVFAQKDGFGETPDIPHHRRMYVDVEEQKKLIADAVSTAVSEALAQEQKQNDKAQKALMEKVACYLPFALSCFSFSSLSSEADRIVAVEALATFIVIVIIGGEVSQ